MFVPRAQGLSSALNKKVFDVYEIMQPSPRGAGDTRDIAGLRLSARIKPTICPLSAVGVPGVLIPRLRAISGIVHAHHSCGGKREKLSGPVFRPFSNSHQYGFQIRLRLVDISALSN